MWLIFTIFVSELINYIPNPFSIELDNQITILYYLSIYACTLLFAFLEDLHNWKKVILSLDSNGENKHRRLVVDTLCTFCSTVLFSYLLMIQASTGQVFSDYSPTTGSAISWKLNMIVAWLACSFVSINLVLNHSFTVKKNKRDKRIKDISNHI